MDKNSKAKSVKLVRFIGDCVIWVIGDLICLPTLSLTLYKSKYCLRKREFQFQAQKMDKPLLFLPFESW